MAWEGGGSILHISQHGCSLYCTFCLSHERCFASLHLIVSHTIIDLDYGYGLRRKVKWHSWRLNMCRLSMNGFESLSRTQDAFDMNRTGEGEENLSDH